MRIKRVPLKPFDNVASLDELGGFFFQSFFERFVFADPPCSAAYFRTSQ
jgi:hypothetical protein